MSRIVTIEIAIEDTLSGHTVTARFDTETMKTTVNGAAYPKDIALIHQVIEATKHEHRHETKNSSPVRPDRR
jgi:hypothetical protein